jgi:hypothetical protein
MQAFDLEYEAIGAALGGSWDMTLWGVAFEDFLGMAPGCQHAGRHRGARGAGLCRSTDHYA